MGKFTGESAKYSYLTDIYNDNTQKIRSNSNYDKIIYLSETNRRSGSSTWILISAIYNPRCVIVSGNLETSRDLQYKYDRLIETNQMISQIYNEVNNQQRPMFKTINDDISGYNIPIIFDNSCFF